MDEQAQLGLATTQQLLEELEARMLAVTSAARAADQPAVSEAIILAVLRFALRSLDADTLAYRTVDQ